MTAERHMPSFQDPVDISTLLADPTVGLPRDTDGYEKRDYKVRFQPDIVGQPEVGFVSGVGAFGASQLAFSDLLGDHNLFIAASVYGSLSDSDLPVHIREPEEADELGRRRVPAAERFRAAAGRPRPTVSSCTAATSCAACGCSGRIR